MNKILYVVHCVDTEGPLNEKLNATFERLHSLFGIEIEPTLENLDAIQKQELPLNGHEKAVAECFSPELLKYNRNWDELDLMLKDMLSPEFRNRYVDDYGNGWKFSWHIMDHMGIFDNPREKDLGYGKIFRHYREILKKNDSNSDEINWHFHPLSLTRKSTHAATSYLNNYDVLTEILCRRIIEDNWFPTVHRPGFHSERPDSHAFLEQWIPFDYANQYIKKETDQPDAIEGRFGDWNRSPSTWRGYHPSHDDYQERGFCKRVIFRCLNVGTRFRLLSKEHVAEAFSEAEEYGSAILAFANHDFRDMRPDVREVFELLTNVKSRFPNVKIKFAGAEEASIMHLGYMNKIPPKLNVNLNENRLIIELEDGEIFGPQPFLAIKNKNNAFFHDNLDVLVPKKKWAYIFDDQTLAISSVCTIGIGTAGLYGQYFTKNIKID
jgi:hypothetical protein